MAEKRLSDIFNDVLGLLENKAEGVKLYCISLIPVTNADYIASVYLLMVAFTLLYGLWFMRIEYLFYKKKLKLRAIYMAERTDATAEGSMSKPVIESSTSTESNIRHRNLPQTHQ